MASMRLGGLFVAERRQQVEERIAIGSRSAGERGSRPQVADCDGYTIRRLLHAVELLDLMGRLWRRDPYCICYEAIMSVPNWSLFIGFSRLVRGEPGIVVPPDED
ncbi:unnamed protein product [Toxocara canis]|uniref:Uncharacterized protein n=1 Tax=Toxocara canis TaxID=6265 RepID=A0A183U482_TOXCA|nr:unnamed protein product [Toxocara canis]